MGSNDEINSLKVYNWYGGAKRALKETYGVIYLELG